MYIYWLCVDKVTPGPALESIPEVIRSFKGFDCVRVLESVFCIRTSILRWGKLLEIVSRLLGEENRYVLTDPLRPDAMWKNLLIEDHEFEAFCRDKDGRTVLHQPEN